MFQKKIVCYHFLIDYSVLYNFPFADLFMHYHLIHIPSPRLPTCLVVFSSSDLLNSQGGGGRVLGDGRVVCALGIQGGHSRWFHFKFTTVLTGSTISTLLHDRINPKDCQVLSLGDTGFLQFFWVVSRDYGKPRLMFPIISFRSPQSP